MLIKHLVLLLCIMMTACVPSQQKETVRICDSDGCAERPRHDATHDPAAGLTQEDPYISTLTELVSVHRVTPFKINRLTFEICAYEIASN